MKAPPATATTRNGSRAEGHFAEGSGDSCSTNSASGNDLGPASGEQGRQQAQRGGGGGGRRQQAQRDSGWQAQHILALTARMAGGVGGGGITPPQQGGTGGSSRGPSPSAASASAWPQQQEVQAGSAPPPRRIQPKAVSASASPEPSSGMLRSRQEVASTPGGGSMGGLIPKSLGEWPALTSTPIPTPTSTPTLMSQKGMGSATASSQRPQRIPGSRGGGKSSGGRGWVGGDAGIEEQKTVTEGDPASRRHGSAGLPPTSIQGATPLPSSQQQQQQQQQEQPGQDTPSGTLPHPRTLMFSPITAAAVPTPAVHPTVATTLTTVAAPVSHKVVSEPGSSPVAPTFIPSVATTSLALESMISSLSISEGGGGGERGVDEGRALTLSTAIVPSVMTLGQGQGAHVDLILDPSSSGRMFLKCLRRLAGLYGSILTLLHQIEGGACLQDEIASLLRGVALQPHQPEGSEPEAGRGVTSAEIKGDQV